VTGSGATQVAALGAEPVVLVAQRVLDDAHEQTAELPLVAHEEARAVAQEVEQRVVQVVAGIAAVAQERAEPPFDVLAQPWQARFDQRRERCTVTGVPPLQQLLGRGGVRHGRM